MDITLSPRVALRSSQTQRWLRRIFLLMFKLPLCDSLPREFCGLFEFFVEVLARGENAMKIVRPRGAASLLTIGLMCGTPASADDYNNPLAARLPEPSLMPLAVETGSDPILAIADAIADETAFHEVLAEALKASPVLAEGRADGAAALAGKRGADSTQFPRLDLAISGNTAFAREYSNDPDNVIERSRGSGRIDATATLEQVLMDFGASRRRIDAAVERIGAAEAEYDRKAEGVALRAISAWYNLFAYGHLSELAANFINQNEELRRSVDLRIDRGVAAPVERARVDSALASAKLRLAQYQRELSNARSRFTELFSLDAPARIARAPSPELLKLSDDALAERAAITSPVRVAEANARAARQDARAANADTLPSLTAGVDAGRFGLLEKGRTDYDVRGRLTVRYRIGGPGQARADEARATAEAAEARAISVRLEAEREARIAWSDVAALDDSMVAYREDYLASRVTRDAVFERFRVARGTLFDAIDAQERLFISAAGYIRAMAERDAATYIALARAGELLRVLGVEPADQRIFR
jgi:outer membrane protein, adhesin transport system